MAMVFEVAAEQKNEAGRSVVVEGTFRRVRRGFRTALTGEAEPAPREPVRTPARVAVMLALAHKIQQAIDRGDLKDQADAARRLGLTRARITQLLDLTLLAPRVQEEILFLEAVDGREPVTERGIRAGWLGVCAWLTQGSVWVSASQKGCPNPNSEPSQTEN